MECRIYPSAPFSPAPVERGWLNPRITDIGKALQDHGVQPLISTLSPAQALGATSSPSLGIADVRQRDICSFAVELLNLIHILLVTLTAKWRKHRDGMGLCPSQPGKLLVLGMCAGGWMCTELSAVVNHHLKWFYGFFIFEGKAVHSGLGGMYASCLITVLLCCFLIGSLKEENLGCLSSEAAALT